VLIIWLTAKSIFFYNPRGERAKYKHHQDKAKANPEKYASIIIDGMAF